MKRHQERRASLIGITPDLTPSNSFAVTQDSSLFLAEQYSQAIIDGGGIPIVLPPNIPKESIPIVLDQIHGLLVTGGNFDIHPTLYGESPTASLREIKQERTEFELELITLALDRDLPILGVCGGQQAINVVLGGTLYQDIVTQIPQALEHEQKAPKVESGHTIKILPKSKLHRIVGCLAMEVNTTHHQAVKQPGRGLITNATAEDGVIEGIESTDHRFVLGVQWHPEFLVHSYSTQKKIFSSFISACTNDPP